MKVIKATKYLDIHYFHIHGQHAPHKILSHHNSPPKWHGYESTKINQFEIEIAILRASWPDQEV